MTIAQSIEIKLKDAFAPEELVIEDQSENHRGHAGWREGGQTHFHIRIRSKAFGGQTRVQIHRKIYDLLHEELESHIHALALDATAS